jgi:hypothetical protein
MRRLAKIPLWQHICRKGIFFKSVIHPVSATVKPYFVEKHLKIRYTGNQDRQVLVCSKIEKGDVQFMFCAKCGQQMPDGTKYCPRCGAPTGAGTPASRPAPRTMQASYSPVQGSQPAPNLAQAASARSGKSIFRIILMVFGLLHIVIAFVASYGKLHYQIAQLLDMANQMDMRQYLPSSLARVGSAIPERLTAFNAARLMLATGEDYAGISAVILMLPVVLGILFILLNAIGKKKSSYIFTFLLSLVAWGDYGFISLLLSDLDRYYEIGSLSLVVMFLSVIQLVLALVACFVDKSARKINQLPRQ